MTPWLPKSPRLRLAPESYRKLHRKVLERDGWRCQECGHLGEVQVHHIQARGRLGSDVEDNLITLCPECHGRTHGKKYSPGGVARPALRAAQEAR